MLRNIACITIGVMATATALAEKTEVKAKLVSATEMRKVEYEKSKKDSNTVFFDMSASPGLTFKIRLIGEAAGAATHYGELKLKEAKTDAGESLKLKSGGFNDPTEEFVKIDREMMFMGEETPKDQIVIEITVDAPAREAKTLKAFEGALKLRVGEPAAVSVEAVKSKEGDAVSDPALKEAGVKATVKKADGDGFMSPDEPANAVVLELKGKLDNVLDVKLVGADGKEISASTMRMGGDDAATYILEAEEKIPADAKLEIIISKGAKEIDVPFAFEDVKLP